MIPIVILVILCPICEQKADGYADGNVSAVAEEAKVSGMLKVKPSLIVNWPASRMTMVSYTDSPPKAIADMIGEACLS